MFSAQMKGCLPKVFTKYFIFLFLLLFSAVAGGSFAHDAVRPLLQALVFFFGEPHERAVLRMFHALHGDGGVEVGEFLVGLTDAVSFGFGGVFDVGHAPGRVAHQLEGRAALTLLLPSNFT